jgi:hypothetical protein
MADNLGRRCPVSGHGTSLVDAFHLVREKAPGSESPVLFLCTTIQSCYGAAHSFATCREVWVEWVIIRKHRSRAVRGGAIASVDVFIIRMISPLSGERFPVSRGGRAGFFTVWQLSAGPASAANCVGLHSSATCGDQQAAVRLGFAYPRRNMSANCHRLGWGHRWQRDCARIGEVMKRAFRMPAGERIGAYDLSLRQALDARLRRFAGPRRGWPLARSGY